MEEQVEGPTLFPEAAPTLGRLNHQLINRLQLEGGLNCCLQPSTPTQPSGPLPWVVGFVCKYLCRLVGGAVL